VVDRGGWPRARHERRQPSVRHRRTTPTPRCRGGGPRTIAASGTGSCFGTCWAYFSVVSVEPRNPSGTRSFVFVDDVVKQARSSACAISTKNLPSQGELPCENVPSQCPAFVKIGEPSQMEMLPASRSPWSGGRRFWRLTLHRPRPHRKKRAKPTHRLPGAQIAGVQAPTGLLVRPCSGGSSLPQKRGLPIARRSSNRNDETGRILSPYRQPCRGKWLYPGAQIDARRLFPPLRPRFTQIAERGKFDLMFGLLTLAVARARMASQGVSRWAAIHGVFRPAALLPGAGCGSPAISATWARRPPATTSPTHIARNRPRSP